MPKMITILAASLFTAAFAGSAHGQNSAAIPAGIERLHQEDVAATVALIYDAMGQMVEQQSGTCFQQIIYTQIGKMVIMNGQVFQKALVALPGGATAVYNASGLAYYRHTDWLGSARLATTPSRTVYSSSAYAPYGEQYAPPAAADVSFTGQGPDTTSGLYDFMFRKYSWSQGRWVSPDPAGLGAADPTSPQSWNRYAYVINSPLNLIDPLGLIDIYFWENGCLIHGSSASTQSYQKSGIVDTVTWSYEVEWCGGSGQNPSGGAGLMVGGVGGARAANTGTIRAGTLDQLNDYCSARGRAKFIADWLPGGGTIARTLWGSHTGDQLGFYQLSVADLNNITGENSGGQTVAMHAASEGLKAAAGSTAFLSWFRGATGVPKTLASTWLGRLSVALIVADASSGFYKEGKEILNCQAGN